MYSILTLELELILTDSTICSCSLNSIVIKDSPDVSMKRTSRCRPTSYFVHVLSLIFGIVVGRCKDCVQEQIVFGPWIF